MLDSSKPPERSSTATILQFVDFFVHAAATGATSMSECVCKTGFVKAGPDNDFYCAPVDLCAKADTCSPNSICTNNHTTQSHRYSSSVHCVVLCVQMHGCESRTCLLRFLTVALASRLPHHPMR